MLCLSPFRMDTMEQNKRGSNNWIGFVIFFVLVLGSRIFPPLASWLTQVSGVPISSTMIYGVVVVLGLILPVVVSAISSVRLPGGGGDTRLPTQPGSPIKLDQPPMPVERLPDWARPNEVKQLGPPPSVSPLPSWTQPKLPMGQPQFEPIINPRVLTIGVIGLICFGLIFGLLLIL